MRALLLLVLASLILAAGASYLQGHIPQESGMVIRRSEGRRVISIDHGRSLGGGCNAALEDCSLRHVPPRYTRLTEAYRLVIEASPQRVRADAESIVSFTAKSATDGEGPKLHITVNAPSFVILPADPFELLTPGDATTERQIVLAPMSAGPKKVLVEIRPETLLPAPTTESEVLQPDRTYTLSDLPLLSDPRALIEDYPPAETIELDIEVFLPLIWGLDRQQLEVTRIIAGMIGLPALILAALGLFRRRRLPSPAKPNFRQRTWRRQP